MSVTLTHETTLSRVKIVADGLASATEALVERSTDQIRWTTVRGGTAVAVTGGTSLPLYDYEFAPNVANYYRVTATDVIDVVTGAAASHADNASVVPALPAGHTLDDLLMCFGAIRNSGAGLVDLPTDYSNLLQSGSLRVSGKAHDGTETSPTQSFTGGVAGATCSAMMARVRGVGITLSSLGRVGFATQSNGSAQDIATPALAAPSVDGCLILYIGWKQDDWTSVASPGTEIQEGASALGDDQGIVWSYQVQTTATAVAAGSFVVTGGASAISRGMVLAFAPATIVQTNNITPTHTEVWLKSVARPFLNRSVQLLGQFFDVEHPSREGLFDVVGRSLPVAVSDVRGARRYSLRVRTDTQQEADDLELLLASGDILFLHAPAGAVVPAGGVFILARLVTVRAPVPARALRFTDIAVNECAAPGPDVVGAQSTCQTVINTYATVTALIAAHATCADVLTLIGDGTEVIVP